MLNERKLDAGNVWIDLLDPTPEEMEKVGAKLREQRPLLRGYTTDPTSVQQSLASGEVVAAMTWNDAATALKKQGVKVEFMKPKEGMLTWSCGFVMLKDAKNVDLAYDFINSRMEPESGKELYLQQRVADTGRYYASPVVANGHIYLTSLDSGTVTVLKAGSSPPEVVVMNPALGERVAATPAIADNVIYIRTEKHLYAFAEKK